MKMYQYKSGNGIASIKDADVKQGIVTGYFAAFGNVDSDGDIISKGAFTKTIAEQGPNSKQPRIKHLMNHDTSKPLGKINILQEDTKGLYYESQVGSHNLGKDFIQMVDSGLITEHSIGFRTIKKNQIQDYEGYIKDPAKGWYELTELKLYEGSSLTAWGANPETPLTGMKSFSAEEINNRIKSIEKFCRNSEATDETIELLLIEIKQLQQYIIDLTTEPRDHSAGEGDLLNVLETFTNKLKAENGRQNIAGTTR